MVLALQHAEHSPPIATVQPLEDTTLPHAFGACAVLPVQRGRQACAVLHRSQAIQKTQTALSYRGGATGRSHLRPEVTPLTWPWPYGTVQKDTPLQALFLFVDMLN